MKKIGLVVGLCVLFSGAWAQEEWPLLEQQAKNHLINLINIDTAQPDPDELAAARYIYKQFNKNQIDWDIFIPRKKNANLLARIKGTDPTQKPLLLISHLDTAPAAPGWTRPPFKATEENGRIYGLGATDAKNYTAIYLALFNYLKNRPEQPARDIIFLATSSEESGSETGLLWLAGTHWKDIAPGYALNEGGGIIRSEGQAPLVFAEAATKMYMDIKMTAKGEASHSSIPVSNNAVYTLSQALSKIANYNPPARLTPTAETFFKTILPRQTQDGQTTLQLLFADDPDQQQAAAEVMAQDPFFRSQLKNTLTPTELSARTDAGATSAAATALINARLLPGTDPDELLADLAQLFADTPDISLEILDRPQTPAAPAMDGADPLFASISATAKRLLPGAVTVPGMSPASSDSEFLRRQGVITYGLGPEMDPTTPNTAHTADEFITEQDFFNQLRFVAGVVFDFAYGKELIPLTENASLTASQE